MPDNDSPRYIAVNLTTEVDADGGNGWAVQDTAIDSGSPYVCTEELEVNCRLIANALNAYVVN